MALPNACRTGLTWFVYQFWAFAVRPQTAACVRDAHRCNTSMLLSSLCTPCNSKGMCAPVWFTRAACHCGTCKRNHSFVCACCPCLLAVLPNLAPELSKYDPAHPWYIGTPSTVWLKQHAWGNFAVGGAGLILSRGALARMSPTLAGCALVWSQVSGDKSLSECVLAHGIPLTHHAGLHQSDCWSLQELIHHPAAPLLSLHKSHPRLSQPVKQALLVNPWAFAQQARCPVTVAEEPHVLHISSGLAATLWPAKGRHMQQHMLLMPAARADIANCTPRSMKESDELQHLQPGAQHVTLPVAARRPPPLAHFNVSTTSAGCGQASAQVCTTYTLSKVPMPSKRHLKGSKPSINGSLVQDFHTILVQEPLWEDRWRQPPIRLCCSHVNVVTEGTTGKRMEVVLSNDPSQCIWEGF
jgi:hypothetical protein